MMEPEVLYHYCSNETLVSILNGKSIRLSSLKQSNDSMEGRLVTEALMRMASRDNLDEVSQSRLRSYFEHAADSFDGLGFCLSEKADVLSQWRGYADDGRGVAIGFSRNYLEARCRDTARTSLFDVSLQKVIYQPNEHDAAAEQIYKELTQHIARGALDTPGMRGLLDGRSAEQIARDDEDIRAASQLFLNGVLDLVPQFFQLKSEAFIEESEWRLVSVVHENRFEGCEFRASGAKIIPFRSFELKPLGTDAIVEVVLGPKHASPTHVVKSLLARSGFSNATVEPSRATYR